MQPTLFVVGPTASGKTALAVELAVRFEGEIVNVDSRQFYRGMTIGSAKPTAEEQRRARHHLIDIAEPDETVGLGLFLDLAHLAIADIRARDRLPIVAGGTGQYVRALLDAWDVPRVPPDPELRAELEAWAARDGLGPLLAELDTRDPERGATIDRRNLRRIVRALEVARSRGEEREPPPFRVEIERPLVLGIAIERQALYERIDARVDSMFASGFVDELRSLREQGYGGDLISFSAIGYREVCDFLDGALTLEAARDRTKTGTHRLARTQAAWFRATDPRIRWLESGPNLTQTAIDESGAYLSALSGQG